MTETKRQHHVPRTYLKYFADLKQNGAYNIHAMEPNSEKPPFQSNITKVCVKKNIYTLEGDTPEQRQLVENFYSRNLEAHYDRAYNILTDPDRKQINMRERHQIISTVFTMFYRTARWGNIHNNLIDRVLSDAYKSCVETGKDKFYLEKKEVSIKGLSLEQLQKQIRQEGKDAMILTQVRIANQLIIRRLRDGIVVVKTEGPDSELITSDQPVVMSNINKGLIAPFDPNNMVELPLDSKHMLIIMPHQEESDPALIVRRTQKGGIAKIMNLAHNYKQLQTTDKHLLGSKQGLITFKELLKETDRDMTPEESESLFDMESIVKKMEANGLS